MKPHGRDCPDRCSMCQGAVPRVVAIGDSGVTVDEQPIDRGVDPSNGVNSYYARRGGRARGTKPPR